jgi:hypothetical protein
MLDSTAITRELGARLRECRERAGLRTADVARKLGWPASKVSRLESGDRRCDPYDLARYLGTCDVKQDDAWPLIRLAHQPDTGVWPRIHGDQLPDQLLTVVMNETTASTIFHYQPIVIPGLIQTRNYAAAVIRASITANPEDVEPRLKARMQRQGHLKERDSAQASFFIDEPVLHRQVGSAADMSEQLLHLVLLPANPRIKIRIVPSSKGAHPGVGGPFMFFGYTDRQPVVYLESEVVSTFVEDKGAVKVYRAIRSELDRIALSEEESQSMLTGLASMYDRDAEEQSRDGGPVAQEQPLREQ